MTATINGRPGHFQEKKRQPRPKPGHRTSKPRWELKWRLLIYRLHEPFLGAYDPAINRAYRKNYPADRLIADVKRCAPEIYDWWIKAHPNSKRYTFEEWVTKVYANRYYYMFTNVATRHGEISKEHPFNWKCYKLQNEEWKEAVSWVEDRIKYGAPK